MAESVESQNIADRVCMCWVPDQASGMGTGGFMSPPSGESFSGADNRPAVGAQGPPGAVKGLNPGEGEGRPSCPFPR